MTKVVVCRVGEEPKVEDVVNPYTFASASLGCGYIQAKLFWLEKDRVVFYWDEDALMKKLPLNRKLPAIVHPPDTYDFSVDTRPDPERYAKFGEQGYFPIHGPFLVTKADAKGDHVSLSQEEIVQLVKLLELKCEYCGLALAYPGARFCGAACSASHEMKL